MTLYFRYGSYSFPSGAVSFTSSESLQYSAMGFPVLTRKRMDLEYYVQGTSPSNLTSLLSRLQAALVSGKDLGLYESSGLPTAHVWRNSDTHGGVRVMGGDFPLGDGTEYVTGRTVNLSFEADFPVRGMNTLLSSNETVTIVGDGGPEEIYLPVLRGKWQKQIVSERSIVTATQAGELIGWGAYPPVPRPLWPQHVIGSQKSRTKSSPVTQGGDIGECKISYSYSFQANEPLI